MMEFFQQLHEAEWFTGRKVNRWTVNMLCAGLSLVILYAALRWANGAELPKLPGETIILALVPYAQSIFDNFFRSKDVQHARELEFHTVNAGS